MRTFTMIISSLVLLQLVFSHIITAVTIATPPPICENTSCDRYCPYGHMRDDIGCRSCKCSEPCANKKCPLGEECRVEAFFCKETQPRSCAYLAMCRRICPLVLCTSPCPFGFEVGKDGCQTCQCKDPCKNLTCPRREICTLEHFGAYGVKAKCTKECPDLPCHSTSTCRYGFEMDCDNCATCACRNPCAGVTCSRGHYCMVQQIYCITDPCPQPWASCEPYCPENSSSLIGLSDYAVQCTTGAWNCPKGYDCVNVPYLNQSYCCSAPSQ